MMRRHMRGDLAGNSKCRPRDLATSIIFLSPTTGGGGVRQQTKQDNNKTTNRKCSCVRGNTCGYLKEGQIIVGVAEDGESLAEH